MKIVVDFDICEANGVCVDLAPNVFDLDDEDILHILMANPTEESHEKVRLAVQRCPRQAIRIEE